MVQMIDGGIIVQSRDNVDQAKEHNHPVHANGISKNRTSSVVAGEPDVADDKRVSGTMQLPEDIDILIQAEADCQEQGIPFKKLSYDMLIDNMTDIAVVDAVKLGLIDPANEQARKIIESQRDVVASPTVNVQPDNPLFVHIAANDKVLTSEYTDHTKDYFLKEDLEEINNRGTQDQLLVGEGEHNVKVNEGPDPDRGPEYTPSDESMQIEDHNVIEDMPELAKMQEMMQAASGLSAEAMAETEALAATIAGNATPSGVSEELDLLG